MQVMIERCCGLDVHQDTIVACLLVGRPGFRPTKEVRTFRTMTRDLEVLRDWYKGGWGDPRWDGKHWGLLVSGLCGVGGPFLN
jgi:hypothetical protein